MADGFRGGVHMFSGMAVLCIGIGMLVLSAVLIAASFIYRSTAGKRIRKELMEEYR